MKKKRFSVILLALCVWMLLCGAAYADSRAVTSVDISDLSITLDPGQIFLLTASAQPENATNRAINWKSSAPQIARVDDVGRVFAIQPGTANIIAYASDGSGKAASCRVTVRGLQTATPLPTATPKATAQAAATTAVPAATVSSASGKTGAAYVNTAQGGLNMRAEPNKKGKLICVIPRSAAFTVISYGDEWSYVRYNGRNGYVMSSLFQFGTKTPEPTVKATATPSPSPAPTATLKPPAANMARVTTRKGGLNMRTDPQTHATPIRQIPQNAEIEILTYGDTWCYARYKNSTGYVQTRYLTLGSGVKKAAKATAAPTSTPAPVKKITAKTKTAIVATAKGGLNLRETASSRGTRILIIPKNATVQVLTYGDKWTEVSYNGKTGYVQTQYLSAK